MMENELIFLKSASSSFNIAEHYNATHYNDATLCKVIFGYTLSCHNIH